MSRTASGLRQAPAWQVWGALLVIYIVWGSTYLGMRVVVETIPPLLSGGIRFSVSAALMGAILVIRHGPGVLRVSRPEMMGSFLIGVLLLGIGNGMVLLGERDVPSGLAALIVGVVPLVVLVIRRLMGDRIERIQIVGVAGGMVGLVILVAPLGLAGDVAPIGIMFLLASTIAWSYGSIISSRIQTPRDAFVSTFYQFIAGALFAMIAATLAGELDGVDPSSWSVRSLVALGYLITFGSLFAFSTYTWLLQRAPISRIATYAYVNPVVAVALGWLILGEAITVTMVIGAAMILASVALIVRLQRPRPVPEVS